MKGGADSSIIRTPDYRLRVFISSTLRELAEEREAVRASVLKLRLVPVLFESGARPHPAQNLYQAYVSQSHVFIGIYWQSYGWVAPGMQISGLEDEYGLSAGKPRLIYIKEPAPDRETALAALLDCIRAEGSSSYKRFGSTSELAELVENDLALLLTERFEGMQPAPGVAVQATRPPSDLPIPRKSLIGREMELAAVSRLVLRDDVALVTLTGAAGIGKSRLALQVALELLPQFADGAYLVPLEILEDPEHVIPAIARALRLTVSRAETPLLDTLSHYLCGKQTLLVLDNFEHVLGAAPRVADLLEKCPRVKILATSRASLRLRAENVMAVPPLTAPPAGKPPPLERLSEYSAVELFVERAQAVKPDFRVSIENIAAIGEICRRLDGLPLAIELAAARIPLLSPQEILHRLGHRFELLRGGTRDLPQRQRTLHDAIDWSYRLLDPGQQRLLRNLSILSGTWTMEAAAEVACADDGQRAELLSQLESLVDNNLLQPPQESHEELRLGMLETIRDFGRERLAQSGELPAARERHLAYYSGLAELAEELLMRSRQVSWQRRLAADLDDIRQAMQWALDSAQHETVLRMAAALHRFWDVHGYWREGVQWIERALAGDDSASTPAAAGALAAAGLMRARLGSLERAIRDLERSVDLWRRINHAAGLSRALSILGIVLVYRQDFEWAVACLEESIEVQQRSGDISQLHVSLLYLAIAAFSRGEHERALGLYRQALEGSRAASDCSTIALTLINMAELYRELRDWEAAEASLRQAEVEFSGLGDRVRGTFVAAERGMLHLSRGELPQAFDGLSEALRVLRELDQKDYALAVIERLAMVACEGNIPVRAARLLGAASSLRGASRLPSWPADRRNSEQCLIKVRTRLGPAAFETAWRAGAQLAFGEAVEEALTGVGEV